MIFIRDFVTQSLEFSANHLTRNDKIVIHDNPFIILTIYIYMHLLDTDDAIHYFLCWRHMYLGLVPATYTPPPPPPQEEITRSFLMHQTSYEIHITTSHPIKASIILKTDCDMTKQRIVFWTTTRTLELTGAYHGNITANGQWKCFSQSQCCRNPNR